MRSIVQEQVSYMAPLTVNYTPETKRTPETIRASIREKRAKNDLLLKMNCALERQIREVQCELIKLEHRSNYRPI